MIRLFVIGLYLSALPYVYAEGPGNLIVTRMELDPLPEQFAPRLDAQLNAETWVYASRNEFLTLLDKYQIAPEIKELLIDMIKPGSGKREKWETNETIHLTIPRQLKQWLPSEFLSTVYSSLIETGRMDASFFHDKEEAMTFFADLGLGPKGRNNLAKQLISFEAEGKQLFYLPTTPDLRPFLNAHFRETLLNHVKDSARRDSISVSLEVSPSDNISAIAQHYSGGNENAQRRLLQMLTILRQSNHGETFEIPIERLMPRFIRKRLYTWANCNGPNCISAAFNANAPGRPADKGIPEDLAEERLRTHASPVEAGFRPRDLVVFRDPNTQEITHMAVLVGNDGEDWIIFQKDGLSELHPYRLEVIGSEERSRVQVYRPTDCSSIADFARPRKTNRKALQSSFHLDETHIRR